MFIDLNRTFRELIEKANPDDVNDYFQFANFDLLDWPALIKEYRVILLSEAGSGKTAEIRDVATKLIHQKKPAFFLRLEHVGPSFEDAFEEGTYEDFKAWLASDQEGWIFLDSVDEARLGSPEVFDQAIRKIGREIRLAKQRTHLLISGRASAWRHSTDLSLCNKTFPYQLPTTSITAPSLTSVTPLNRDESGTEAAVFKIVSLNGLTPQQAEIFATKRGVADVAKFIDGIERADAWSFATRPIDLEELIEFWKENARIGTRLELMENSVKRRLKEQHQKHDESQPLSLEKARAGANLAAAACTLTRQQTIQTPDGAHDGQGLPISEMLPNWNAAECSTLLGRPIFGPAIYRAVRLHTRTVREYLTALWIVDLLQHQTSRRAVEGLLFREQYGIEVVIPTMRPTLPWIALFDEKIRAKLSKIAPEVFFEGGDPSRLPFETRRQILRDACDRFATRTSGRSIADLGSVQRFTNSDLTTDIGELLTQYKDNHDVLWVLLRMVWQGGLVDLLPQALSIAKDSSIESSTRVAAFRAIGSHGTDQQMQEIRQAVHDEAEEIDRDLLAALIDAGAPTADVISWLFDCLRKTEGKPRFSVDTLDDALSEMATKCGPDLLVKFIEAGHQLTETPPVVERLHCEISSKYSWLLKPLAVAVERLIELRSEAVFEPTCLAVIRKVAVLRRYEPFELSDEKLRLGDLVKAWPELKMAAFWDLVEQERAWLDGTRKERLYKWWQVGLWSSYVAFTPEDIDPFIAHIETRTHPDDKHVALSAAFRLYEENGRPESVLTRLQLTVEALPELKAHLDELITPPEPSEQARELQRTQEQWEAQAKEETERRDKHRADVKQYLEDNPETIRNPGFDDPSAISQNQAYLMERIRENSKSSSDRPYEQWQLLRNEFSDAVATAYRDGAVRFWRGNKPELISEGHARNTTRLSTVFGLAGLSIEAHENKDAIKAFTPDEVELAFRYAMHELNGFPAWFPRLFQTFPDALTKLAMREISFELDTEDPQTDHIYLLHDVSWSGEWMWDSLAPYIVERFKQQEPRNQRNLDFMLSIIQGSSLPDDQIAALAAEKLKSNVPLEHMARWFAAWVGAQPDVALPELDKYLCSLPSADDQKQAAMIFISKLLGGRRESTSRARDAFKTPEHLKSLYLLMHRYIKRSEDIDRANGGVYSPGLRDDAQDARDRLFEMLNELPGKNAFLAMSEIAETHPDPDARPWFRRRARSKAEADADSAAWSLSQVVDFQKTQERTPANHQELYELALLRIADLKDDLEQGDSSDSELLRKGDDEILVRKYIGGIFRRESKNRFSIEQEPNLADEKEPDLRFVGNGFDAPVPVELKLADNWTGPKLFERLENQLCGDYLRDRHSARGIFLLVNRGIKKQHWEIPGEGGKVDFDGLLLALQNHWVLISKDFPGIDEIKVIGIDLTLRSAGGNTHPM